MRYKLRISNTGNVAFGGVDMGNRTPMQIVAHRENVYVIKVPAGSYWQGIAMPHAYKPVEYIVLSTSKPVSYDAYTEYDAEVLVNWNPGSEAKA